MKYVSFVMALLLSLAISLPVSANDLPTDKDVTLRVKEVKTKTLDVTLINLQQQRTSISLKALNGSDTFFEDTINKHNGYRKRLDLRNLTPGKYILTVEQDGKKLRQVIVIDNQLGMLLSDIVG